MCWTADHHKFETTMPERLQGVFDPLVAAGTITSDQRDAVIDALLSQRRSMTGDSGRHAPVVCIPGAAMLDDPSHAGGPAHDPEISNRADDPETARSRPREPPAA
ncbi:MAG: hypothetical protein F4Y94_11700 [Chloroflexi bacterium]|nr:hypothetical protein [Chloroflexota bacterium]